MPTRRTRTRLTDAHLLRLLTWLSPAFPTGGFAYSGGLEWAVETGDVRDEATLLGWLHALLSHGTLRQDAILLRAAHRGDPDASAVAHACATARERRDETIAQGDAFARAARLWCDVPDAPYPVAVGHAARAEKIGEDAACLAFLHAAAGTLISAAVRLIPLGQTAGLRVIAALEPALLATAAETRDATLDDLGTACFAADIASMRHETQHTRLFRS